jgi:hypothetical protein
MKRKMFRKKLNLQKQPKIGSELLKTGKLHQSAMKRIFIYHLAFILSFTVRAQDISIKAEYPSVVNAGEQFTVSWKVNSGGGEFAAPSFSGFTKLMGPQTSYSSSTQIINGKMSHETSYSYVYYLQAVKEGKFVIAPAEFTYRNKTYASDSMYIEVIGTGSGGRNVQQPVNAGTSDQDVAYAGNDIIVNLSLSRKEVYVGEPVVATIKLYTRVNLSGINEIKYPPFNGFLRSDIATPPLTSLKQENIKGTIYGTGVVQQFLLYPQITGEIGIDPVQISVLVQQKTGQSDPFFGDFFTSYQTIPRTVASQPLKVNVKPLPGSKPSDFSGVIGQLSMKAALNKDTVNVNDPVNFNITISGTGNLKVAETPVLKLSSDIEVYDPKITDDVKNGVNGSSGQKIFEFLLIPRHNGDYVIPPVTYSYFNPSAGRYEKLTTREFKFYAKKGSEQNNAGITVYGGVSKEDVKYLGKDIRFIKSESGRLARASNIILEKRSFYSIYAFATLAFLIILFLRREHLRRNADLTNVRNRKAGKVAVKRLHSAAVCLKNDNMDEFYEEMLRAIWGYLSDKLSIPVSDLTRSNAVEALSEQGIDEDRLNSLRHILDTCEYARYAPSASVTEASTIYEGASQFIKSVENSLT